MSLTTAYLASVKNVSGILEAIQEAGVPERFTNEFLKTLGFSSSSDRAIINVLKGLGFLDTAGKPTRLYNEFKNKPEAKKVLARVLRDAYQDIFLANENAYALSTEKLKGIFSAKTGKGKSVIEKMVFTFQALTKHADFASGISREPEQIPPEEKRRPEEKKDIKRPEATFHYNIQIYLPITKDISVYNAIFKSIKENLLD